MSKFRKIKKKLSQFVNQLTPDQVREQLVLAYLQMERCKQVLRGADVEPVAMLDNGECSDLELFYLCKKLREELDLNNQKEKKPKGESITIGVDVDCSDAIKHLKDFKKSIDGFRSRLPRIKSRKLTDEIVMNVGKIISTHVSFSKDHQCAYFIDQTNRVFKGATWYLNEQGIENFETLDDLRQYLLQNIIDDGKRE